MKQFCLGITVAVGLTLPAFAQRVDPYIGTWKLNMEKLAWIGTPPPQSATITFTPDGQNLAATLEVEVPQPLDLGIVNVVFAWRPRMTKLGTTHEIDTDGHLVPLGIEIHLLDEPRLGDTQSLCKQFIDLIRHFASAAVRQSVPLRAGASRRVNA